MFFRQQSVQGIRYYIFIEFYIISFNLWSLSKFKFNELNTTIYTKKLMAFVTICFFIMANMFDYRKFEIIVNGRSNSFQSFMSRDLSYLKDHLGIAYDIGMIGYFTSATILDPNGLIHGLDVAKLSRKERMEWICNKEKISFAFLNNIQFREISKCLNISNWVDSGQFAFPNYGGGMDVHYLLIDPRIVQEIIKQ